jgi:hypothetical protein
LSCIRLQVLEWACRVVAFTNKGTVRISATEVLVVVNQVSGLGGGGGGLGLCFRLKSGLCGLGIFPGNRAAVLAVFTLPFTTTLAPRLVMTLAPAKPRCMRLLEPPASVSSPEESGSASLAGADSFSSFSAECGFSANSYFFSSSSLLGSNEGPRASRIGGSDAFYSTGGVTTLDLAKILWLCDTVSRTSPPAERGGGTSLRTGLALPVGSAGLLRSSSTRPLPKEIGWHKLVALKFGISCLPNWGTLGVGGLASTGW